MKNRIRFLLLIVVLTAFVGSMSSCRKDIMGCTDYTAVNYNPQANVDDGRCQYEGNAVFWYDQGRSDGTVEIYGLVGYITQYYPVELPSCGSNGCANFTLQAGTYTYHAENADNIWDGSMTVYANQCSLILLD